MMENVLLLEAKINKEDISIRYEEMLNLLWTLDFKVQHIIYQELDQPFNKTYLGTGKIIEIKDYIEDNNINIIVCDFDLTPIQFTFFKNTFDVEIIDRTGVILRIFSKMAKSKEARLQVEIANLKYLKSKLINREANYSQITSGGGLKNRGKGEKQIDLDRNKYRILLKRKQEELKKLVVQRKNNRHERHNLPIVAIVGYTNAGKSTLLNTLLKKSNVKNDKYVLQEDRLFATLETSTRLIDIYNYPPFLLTDTVGFIDDMPTMLVDAFKSTLEEILEADLIVHVVDVSNKNYQRQIDVTNEILHELRASYIPAIYLYNKVDLCTGFPLIPKKNELLTSLNNNEDIPDILNLIFDYLKIKWNYLELKVPLTFGIEKIKKYGIVESVHTFEDYYLIKGYFKNSNLVILKDFLND